MGARRTSLSAGFALYEILTSSAEVRAILGADVKVKVFPVVIDEATLPYVVYRRKRMTTTAVKSPDPNDRALFEFICCTESMEETVALAEAVRGALEDFSGPASGLHIRGTELVDAEDGWEGDAYMMRLDIALRIG